MQTVIRENYVAGLPGQLAVLPSFKSSARVTPHRCGADIPPGEPVILGSGADSTILPFPDGGDVTLPIGISVRANANMPTMPSFGSNTVDGVAGKNTPVGVVENGPVFVKVASGQTPANGDLAVPVGRDATTGIVTWGVAGATVSSRFRFASAMQRGGVAVVMVTDGDVMEAGYTHGVVATGVTVSPATASVAANSTQAFTATVTPSGASQAVNWTSSNEAVATIAADGTATVDPDAAAGLTTTITATTDDGAFTATAVLTVAAAS